MLLKVVSEVPWRKNLVVLVVVADIKLVTVPGFISGPDKVEVALSETWQVFGHHPFDLVAIEQATQNESGRRNHYGYQNFDHHIFPLQWLIARGCENTYSF